MNEIEVRGAPTAVEMPSGGSGRTIRFKPIVFDSLSEDLGGFKERISPGALTKTLADPRDVRCDFEHIAAAVLGSTKARTLRLSPDTTGLWASVDVPDTTTGNDLMALTRRRDVQSASFEMSVVKDHWTNEGGQVVRTVDELTLYSVTLCGRPAYSATTGTVSSRALSEARRLATPPQSAAERRRLLVQLESTLPVVARVRALSNYESRSKWLDEQGAPTGGSIRLPESPAVPRYWVFNR